MGRETLAPGVPGQAPGPGPAVPAEADASGAPPLVVDLDGTVVRTDLLVETAVLALRHNPLSAFQMVSWLAQGRARLKAELARRADLDPADLPYRRPVLEYLQDERARGRRLLLATAADERVARAIADRLGLFDGVLASDGRVNVAGEEKRRRLVAGLGEKGFDYVGNSERDLPVWRSARRVVLVEPSARLLRRAGETATLERVLDEGVPRPTDYLQALRLHHWLKNLLVFTPLVTAHRIADPTVLAPAAAAFLAFGLCASSVYLLNDLMDLHADRHHPRKRERPLAAGRVPLTAVPWLLIGLLVATVAVGLTLPPAFLGVLGLYFAMNLGYSLGLKSVAVLDVLILAGLYTLRIIAGSAAVTLWPSAWLLAFSLFLFLSLALVKRYAELMAMRAVEGARARARGYQLDDAELLAALGGGAGYLATLVLALYLDTAASGLLYTHPALLWALCPLLIYWTSHLWLMAHRKRMHDDPLVFAVHDRVSQVLLVLMALVLLAAA